MNFNRIELENKIRQKVIIKVKERRGKGPLFVNIKIAEYKIFIYIKGIMTNESAMLIKMDRMDLIESIWSNLKKMILAQFVNDLNENSRVKFKIVSEESDFEKDYRIIVLEVVG